MGGTLIILLIAFGAAVAAGVPLFLGITSFVATTGLLGPVSKLMPLHEAVGQGTMLIGWPSASTYAMFYMRRMMEERDKRPLVRRCARRRPPRPPAAPC